MDIYRYGKVLSSELLQLKSREAVHEDNSRDKDYLSSAIPLALLAGFKGTHPKVMDSLVENFETEHSLRGREVITFKERIRLIESAYYKKIGVPCWRNKRYKLLGGYLPKERFDY